MIPPLLLALARAAAAGRPVRISCRQAGSAPARLEVDLLSLGWRFGGWVALVRLRGSGGLRALPLERVASVRALERRRPARGRGQAAGAPPSGVDPIDFALADLQDPDAGPARRVTVRVAPSLALLAGVLFAGARVEADEAGVRVRVTATDAAAVAQMAASLGATVG